jgi:hypothetical protein
MFPAEKQEIPLETKQNATHASKTSEPQVGVLGTRKPMESLISLPASGGGARTRMFLIHRRVINCDYPHGLFD